MNIEQRGALVLALDALRLHNYDDIATKLEPLLSEATDARIDDLRALCIRLASCLRKAAPEHKLPTEVADYLARNGLGMSPLRTVFDA